MKEDSSPSLTESVALLISEARGVVGSTMRLAAAETRLAVVSVLVIFLLLLTGFTLILAAISLLEIAAAIALTNLGLSVIQSAVILAIINILIAASLFWLSLKYSRFLKFEKTINAISSEKATEKHASRPTE